MIDVAVVPYNGDTYENMFDSRAQFYKKDIAIRGTYLLREELKKAGYHLIDAQKADDTVKYFLHYRLFDFETLKKYPNAKHIYCAMEPTQVEKLDSEIDLNRLVRCLYDSVLVRLTHSNITNSVMTQVNFNFDVNFEPICQFADKKLGVFIGADNYSVQKGQLYTERRKIIDYFEKKHPDDFDFYGKNYSEKQKAYRTYQGMADCKLTTSEKYKFTFSISAEKWSTSGIDEKNFDAMIAGTVPVCYPVKYMEEYIPADCYIDYSKFKNLDELYLYLKNMDEKTYNSYLKNIQNYLKSDMVKRFEPKAIAENIIDAIELTAHSVKQDRPLMVKYLYQKRRLYLKLNGLKAKIGRWYHGL